jgi:hypothetical protein
MSHSKVIGHHGFDLMATSVDAEIILPSSIRSSVAFEPLCGVKKTTTITALAQETEHEYMSCS